MIIRDEFIKSLANFVHLFNNVLHLLNKTVCTFHNLATIGKVIHNIIVLNECAFLLMRKVVSVKVID